jgi:FAD/FMN-containing dehydrogenase
MSLKNLVFPIVACIASTAQSSSSQALSLSFDFPPAQAACLELQARYPSATYLSNTSSYDTDNTDFWSQSSALGPACIFAPSLADELGEAVKVLTALRSPFAMRGGGHMPIGDFNNINSSGVLLSSSGFKRLEMAADGESVHVGPGNHWAIVYEFLEPHGKVVVGGRLGIVGIPGFVTGGGASFFSAEYGWASNNVKSFTVSLAQ